MTAIPVIDVFAGPGGLNEGFSRFATDDGSHPFAVAGSFEMDAVACRTLRMRAAVRRVRQDAVEAEAYRRFLAGEIDLTTWSARPIVAAALTEADGEVHQVELGPTTRSASDEVIGEALRTRRRGDQPWVLVGGPPCQAYSLVGRSRRTNDATFADDVKHHLYREYLNILQKFRPHVFVMENVKGLLSHRWGGVRMFDQILEDLREPGYEIRSFVVPEKDPDAGDFVIRAEEYGVPQRRHRVILLGVRHDVAGCRSRVLSPAPGPSVDAVIGRLPQIRSTISPKREDDAATWVAVRDEALALAGLSGRNFRIPGDSGSEFGSGTNRGSSDGLTGWLTGGVDTPVIQHTARGHMTADLRRYAFLSGMALRGQVVKTPDLPDQLLPAHTNLSRPDAPFTDRFRVQVGTRPSTTVVSHISKDGHYYIHPDPGQMRSLTVREAARLQTFPDDYFFCGNRTQQYHQVGNAVPPFLARQLAEVVHDLLRG